MRKPSRRTQPARSPGISIWRSRESLVQSRTRNRIFAGFLGAFSLFTALSLLSPHQRHNITGFISLEILFLPLALYLSFRAHRLTNLISRANETYNDEAAPVAETSSRADTMLWRLSQLVESLAPGPLHDAGTEALEEARRTTRLRAELDNRLHLIDGVHGLLDDQGAARAVQDVSVAYRSQLADIDHQLDRLAGSVAGLVNADEAEGMHDQLSQVQQATERLAAMAQAMSDLNEADSSTAG